MDSKQLEEVSAYTWDIAELNVSLFRCAYLDATPKQKYEKLNAILRAIDSLLALVKSLDHKVGQPLEEHSYDAPLVQEIQTALFILCIRGDSVFLEGCDDYPVSVIRSLQDFRLSVALACDMVKPKRGNSTDRDLTTALKSCIAKNMVFRCRSMFGEFPATSTDGWAAILLNDIFQHYELGDDAGAYWVRREVMQLKKAQGIV